MGGCCPFGTINGQAPMCAGAYSRIVLIAPIDEIVPTFGTGGGVIRDLIGRKASARGLLAGDLVEVSRAVLVGNGQLAARLQIEKRRARLDGKLVERQVVG